MESSLPIKGNGSKEMLHTILTLCFFQNIWLCELIILYTMVFLYMGLFSIHGPRMKQQAISNFHPQDLETMPWKFWREVIFDTFRHKVHEAFHCVSKPHHGKKRKQQAVYVHTFLQTQTRGQNLSASSSNIAHEISGVNGF